MGSCRSLGALATSVLGLGACASLPDTTVQYLPSTWTATLTVTQLVLCSSPATGVFTLNSTTDFALDVRYHASGKVALGTLPVSELDHGFGDLSFAVNLTEDGRLAGINSTGTGQAQTVVTNLAQLVTSMDRRQKSLVNGQQDKTDRTKPGQEAPVDPDVPDETAACAIAALLNKTGPAVITRQLSLTPANVADFSGGKAWNDPGRYPKKLIAVLPELEIKASVGEAWAPIPGPPEGTPPVDGILLKLQKQAPLEVTVSIKSKGDDRPRELGKAVAQIPDEKTYQLPILRSALLGTQGFALGLSDSGALTELKLSKGGAATATLAGLKGVTDATGPAARAAALKAQADELAQRQRLLICQTDSAQCK